MAELDAAIEPELCGVTFQVMLNLLGGREHRRADIVCEVIETGYLAAGVGGQYRPDAAARLVAVPVAAEPHALFEALNIEPQAAQSAGRDLPGGPGADDGDFLTR